MSSLKGVRVLDLSTVMMGPTTTQILSSFGAEVIKIEGPQGDPMRSVGRPAGHEIGPLFHHINHSKKSVVLDLKQPEAREALLKLARTADVLVYNMRDDAMQRLGLGYEAFKARNPKLLYIELSGFGRGGRYAGRPAYDDLIQAAVAIPALMEISTGEGPGYIPLAIADRVVGIYAASAITAGLYHAASTGEGQKIEIPMFEVMTQFVMTDHLGGMTYSPQKGAPGYVRLISPGRRPYATTDGHVAVLPYSDQQWRRLLDVVGLPDLYDSDPRLQGMGPRTEHIDELYDLLADILRKESTDHWVQLFEPLDLPVMRINTLETLRTDPHLEDVGFFRSVDHPTDGEVHLMRSPSRWSNTTTREPEPAPPLGKDTDEILSSLIKQH